MMKPTTIAGFAVACYATVIAAGAYAQTASDIPHLQKQGTAMQLIVDGKPFLALTGELGNNTATSLENMQPIWQRLVAGNLNCVLAAVSWAQVEPEEGKFEFALVDGLIEQARSNHLKLVFLWFGSWKNGLSSYAPYWVKKDYQRFPRIRIQGDRSIELLSTFGDASRDADARAYRALMRHIKEVDGREHTVVMMQVENEVGVLRDSRDRSAAANKAFAGPVPKALMDYLQKHRDTLAPELRDVWAANGFKASGTWEEVFGPGKPDSVEMPIQTNSPPLSKEEYETGWRKLHWPVDEFFMAWNYAGYVGKVVTEGKAEYNIPMYVNAWLQQPNMAWPGTYPCGGPLPQVNDIWRAAAPAIDILAPDLYLEYFDQVADRFTRNGNPLFIPETSINPANALVAFGKYNAIGFSPFFIERSVSADSELAATYSLIARMAPVIAAHQGTDTITAVRLNQGDAPAQFKLGNYTLTASYVGRGRVPIAPQPKPAAQPGAPAQPAVPAQAEGRRPNGAPAPMEAAAIMVNSGADEFYLGGGGIRFEFAANTPGPKTVGLGIVQEGKFVDGKWTVVRQLGGDDIGQGEILTLRPNSILRVLLYRYE
ncbi:MAG: DUF5597 domain-containing protein [Bryobacteraceae bacterium]|jgi:hypothetical protein